MLLHRNGSAKQPSAAGGGGPGPLPYTSSQELTNPFFSFFLLLFFKTHFISKRKKKTKFRNTSIIHCILSSPKSFTLLAFKVVA